MKPFYVTRQLSGFALLEAIVAAGLFALGVLALLGMQSMAIKRTADTRDRTVASMMTSQVLGELWTLGRGVDLAPYTGTFDAASPGTQGWGRQVSQSLPRGSLSVMQRGDQFTITVRWTATGNEAHNHVQSAWIHSDADA